MKKKLFAAVCLLILLFFAVLPVNADEESFLFDPGALTGTLDEESRELLPQDMTSGGVADAGADMFYALTSSLIKSFAKDALLLCGIILIASALSRIGESLSLKYSSDIFALSQVLLIALTAYNMIDKVFDSCVGFTEHINALMSSYGVIMGELYLLGGNISGAASGSAWLALALEFSRKVCISTLIPLIKICFSVSVASSVSQSVNLRAISKFVRNLYTTCTVLFMTVITIIMSFQTTLSASKDSAAIKSVRFAASNSIPIIGSLVGESLRTLSSGISVMKSVSGLVCMLCMAALSVAPLTLLFSLKYSFSLSASFAGFLNSDQASAILSDCGNIINYLIGTVVITDIYFIYFISVFIKSASAVSV